MSPNYFDHLSLSNQSDHLWNSGKFLLERRQGTSFVQLFSYSHFFVEVYFDCTRLRVETIKTIKESEGIEDYLEPIALPDFINNLP